MKILTTLILTSLILSTCQVQKIDLILNLEKGKEYKHIMDSKTTVIQDLNGQKMNIVMIIGGTITYVVKSINGSDYGMDAKFDKLSMSMEFPQGTMAFNSENNDTNDIVSTIFGTMKNKPFDIKMNKTGKVINVENIESLWESIIEQDDQLTEIQKEQVKEQIMKAYGEKAIKGSIEMVTAIFPDHPVKKGDKWTIKTNLESGMSALMTTVYEFVDLTSDYAMIKGNSNIVTLNKDAYIERSGISMKYDLNGSMVSEIKVDKTTGWILEAKINQEIKGVAYIKENPQIPNGLKIPMTMINEMVITDN